MTTNELTTEETKQFSLDEKEILSCQSSSNSNSNSHSGSSNIVNVDGAKYTSDERLTTEKDSTKVIMTSMTGCGLLPVDSDNHSLSEVVIFYNTTDPSIADE